MRNAATTRHPRNNQHTRSTTSMKYRNASDGIRAQLEQKVSIPFPSSLTSNILSIEAFGNYYRTEIFSDQGTIKNKERFTFWPKARISPCNFMIRLIIWQVQGKYVLSITYFCSAQPQRFIKRGNLMIQRVKVVWCRALRANQRYKRTRFCRFPLTKFITMRSVFCFHRVWDNIKANNH